MRRGVTAGPTRCSTSHASHSNVRVALPGGCGAHERNRRARLDEDEYVIRYFRRMDQAVPPNDDPELAAHRAESEALLAEARAGDPIALQRLLERGRDRLRARVRERMGAALRARIDGSDILQSTYIEVVQGIQSFEGKTESDFSGWVATILENNIRNKVRYFQAAKRSRDRETSGQDVGKLYATNRTSTPSSVLEAAEELDLVGAAIARIKDEYARVLLLQTRSELDAQARAEAMGRSQGATRVLLARARAALLAEMERLRQERAHGK